jgi:TolB-like protein
LRYLFEDHELDVDRRELRRGGSIIAVEPKVFDFLVYLIANRGRVVGKDDLVAEVWNGRIVSDSTVTSCINAARSAIGDSGGMQRLVKTLPRKGVRFVGAVREEDGVGEAGTLETSPVGRPDLTPPSRPSIAVLPFVNMSGDPEQEYLADGIVEEIITALSRMRWLFVIARTSSFAYKGRTVDIKQVGRELGVRYVLEGSVRKSGRRLRITGQLIEASTGIHIWADRFDGALKDIFDLQDQVTEAVVGSIEPKLELREIERARRKPTGSLDAYDCYLRAIANYYPATPDESSDMLRLLKRAIDLDPGFAAAYGMASWCLARRKGFGWITDRSQESAETGRFARRAVELAKDDAQPLAWAAFALALVVAELDEATVVIDRALELNPNLAVGWATSGWLRIWRGEPDVAIEHLARAMRLCPLGPMMGEAQSATAHAHFFAGRYKEASAWAGRTTLESPHVPGGLRVLAASNALAGQSERARAAVARLLQIDPKRRVSNLSDVLGPYRRRGDITKYAEGLRKAGLPET